MKRRKYGDCQREDGNCAACSLSSYNRDCHGRAISKLEWYRLVNNMSVTELADASGVGSPPDSAGGERRIRRGKYDGAKRVGYC